MNAQVYAAIYLGVFMYEVHRLEFDFLNGYICQIGMFDCRFGYCHR